MHCLSTPGARYIQLCVLKSCRWWDGWATDPDVNWLVCIECNVSNVVSVTKDYEKKTLRVSYLLCSYYGYEILFLTWKTVHGKIIFKHHIKISNCDDKSVFTVTTMNMSSQKNDFMKSLTTRTAKNAFNCTFITKQNCLRIISINYMFVLHVFHKSILCLILSITFAAFKGKWLACIFFWLFRVFGSFRFCCFFNHASQPPSLGFIIVTWNTSFTAFRNFVIVKQSFSFFTCIFLHSLLLWC